MISDSQLQGGMQSVTTLPVAQIADGQVQQRTSTIALVSQIADAQPQAPKVSSTSSTEATSTPTVTDAAVPGATNTQASVATATPSTSADSPSTSESADMVACRTDNSLVRTLEDGILMDAAGRTGYVFSN